MEQSLNRKIGVVHFISRLATGGMENGIVNICNRLDRKNFIPSICCLKGLGDMTERLKPDVKIYNLNFPEGKAPFRFLEMTRFLKRLSPEIAHTHGWGGCSFDCIIGARLSKVPVVINGEHGGFELKNYQILMQRFACQLCDTNITVSYALKEQFIDTIGLPSNKIKVIQNGVDTDLFNGKHDIIALKNEIFEKFGIDFFNQNKFIIGTVGSLRPLKNQIMLLQAIVKIKEINPDTNILVLIIGDGGDRYNLEKFVQENRLSKQVIFLGTRKDIHILFSLIDISVLTTIPGWEGMSNVVLESMASGKPVIATKTVGNDELIKDQANGFLVDVKDVSGLANRIIMLMNNNDLLRKMGGDAYNFVREKFSIERMVADYEELYLTILNKKSRFQLQ